MIVRALNKVSFKEIFGKWAYRETGGLKSGGVREKRQKEINRSNFLFL